MQTKDKEARLAAALRENLRKRKASAMPRPDAPTKPAVSGEEQLKD